VPTDDVIRAAFLEFGRRSGATRHTRRLARDRAAEAARVRLGLGDDLDVADVLDQLADALERGDL
jgi:hypothetical protein